MVVTYRLATRRVPEPPKRSFPDLCGPTKTSLGQRERPGTLPAERAGSKINSRGAFHENLQNKTRSGSLVKPRGEHLFLSIYVTPGPRPLTEKTRVVSHVL